jgi:hypothetical protein
MRRLAFVIAPTLLALTLAAMALLTAAPLAAAPSLEAAASPEAPIMQAFLDLCAAYPGQPEESIKAATAAGWAPLARKMAPPPPAQMTDGAYRFRSSKVAIDYLYAGHGVAPFDEGGTDDNLCIIGEAPVSPALVLNALEAWVALPPVQVTPGGFRYYAFIDGPNGHRAVTPEGPDYPRAIRNGTMRFVIFEAGTDAVYIGLLTPEPPPT